MNSNHRQQEDDLLHQWLMVMAEGVLEDCQELTDFIKPTAEELFKLPQRVTEQLAGPPYSSGNRRLDDLAMLRIAVMLSEQLKKEIGSSDNIKLLLNLQASQALFTKVLGHCLGIELRSSERQRMLRQKLASEAGLASGLSRQTTARAEPEKVRKAARLLEETGTPKREIASKLAGRFHVTPERIRQILRKKAQLN